MTKLEILDKQRGMFFGMAVGDALGCPVEFLPRDTFAPVTGYRTGTHSQRPGTYTDDTAMGVALALSLAGGFHLDDQLDHYCRWRKGDPTYNPAGCFDIGGQTSQALSQWSFDKKLAGSGLMGESRSGNGSIMRLAPVPVKYLPGLAQSVDGYDAFIDLCGLSSMTTHPNRRCVSACRLLGCLMGMLALGHDAESIFKPESELVENLSLWADPDPVVLDLWRSRSFLTKQPHAVRSGGYVMDTLEAALWAFCRTQNYPDCVLLAVNLGGDADTTGAVAGMLAGAAYGYLGIPTEWQTGLQGQEQLEAAFQGICL
jgi:ADP-ribosyl-[dinitrogen reductase] hydrolase